MAKKATTKKPWVTFTRDPKTGSIVLSRRGDADCHRLQFPRAGSTDEARLMYEGVNPDDTDDGIYLDYSDVQWLAQAIPELLNEMERAGVEK